MNCIVLSPRNEHAEADDDEGHYRRGTPKPEGRSPGNPLNAIARPNGLSARQGGVERCQYEGRNHDASEPSRRRRLSSGSSAERITKPITLHFMRGAAAERNLVSE
jgi:hypothetical protein